MSKRTRKILYSPGFGAGWTSWEASKEIQKFMLTYRPLIKAVESGDAQAKARALEQFRSDCQERFGSVPYLGGSRDLTVAKVSGPVRIHEYDGSESIEEAGDFQDWL